MEIKITHVIELSPALMTMLASSVSHPALSQSAQSVPAKPAPMPAATSNANTAEIDTGKDLEAKATDTVNGVGETAATGEVDAGGHPWSADLHASTKNTTKDGYWRMKVGVSRPADLPGFPKDAGTTGTANAGTASTQAASAEAAPAGQVEDEDEFAAFRAAADKSNAGDAAAAASVPARKWTDADLGALCNQAAVKLGDPAPVKAIIEQFAKEGETPHSRNIPDDKREDFAKAVEAKAGIEFAG